MNVWLKLFKLNAVQTKILPSNFVLVAFDLVAINKKKLTINFTDEI